jgi:hypothetical protein
METKIVGIGNPRSPRQGWAEAFRAAGSSADDELPLEGMEPNDFDRDEWEW